MKHNPHREVRSVDVACPACGHRPSAVIVPSTQGVYCSCGSCSHMWQQADYRSASAARETPLRRRSDRPASLCPYCRQAAEDQHQCSVVDLQRRIAELESENADLRQSSMTFGDLADRLNHLLREHVRSRD